MAFPPLANSDFMLADRDRAVRVVLKGLTGPVTVNGVTLNSAMPPQEAVLTDAQIADVLTYVFNSWGNSGDAVRVGAHQRHVSGGSIGAPNDCDVCHVTPSEALSSGHVDSATASVVYGGLAVQGGAAPVWTRASATCASTYCHGSYSGVYTYFYWEEERTVPYQGLRATAIWTGGPMTCGSCHGNPPRTGVWHSGSHAGGNDCQLCHPNATGVNGAGTAITNRATHANGALDVAPQWNSRCFRCH